MAQCYYQFKNQIWTFHIRYFKNCHCKNGSLKYYIFQLFSLKKKNISSKYRIQWFCILYNITQCNKYCLNFFSKNETWICIDDHFGFRTGLCWRSGGQQEVQILPMGQSMQGQLQGTRTHYRFVFNLTYVFVLWSAPFNYLFLFN